MSWYGGTLRTTGCKGFRMCGLSNAFESVNRYKVYVG